MLNRLARLWRNLRHRQRVERDLHDELRGFVDMAADEYIEKGLSPSDARRLATLDLGGIEPVKERVRASRAGALVESLAQDVHYAVRSLRRQPGFTLTTLAILAVGVGLNTSLATMFTAMLWRTWPLAVANDLVHIQSVRPDGRVGGEFSWADFTHLSAHARNSTIVATGCGMDGRMINCRFTLADRRTVIGQFVSGNYFRALEIPIALGRGIHDGDGGLGLPGVVVVSHTFWLRELGASPDVVGRRIDLDGAEFEVIGVTAESFSGTLMLRQDLWVPLASAPILRPSTRSSIDNVELIARLGHGVTPDQARAEIDALLAPLPPEPRRSRLAGTSFFSRPRDREESMMAFSIALAALLLVLIVACANTGNLLLARTVARRQEIAIRNAIGAGRARLVRQLLTESFVLAAAASAIGLAIATVVPNYLLNLGFEHADVGGRVAFAVRPDWRVALFSAGLATLTCIAFGLAPALHASRVDVLSALKGRSAGSPSGSLRSWLLGVQVAVSVILLGAAGLLVRGLERAYVVDRGFDPQGVTVVSFDLPASFDLKRRQAFEAGVIAAAGAIEARSDAAIASATPFDGWIIYARATGGEGVASRAIWLSVPEVSPGYFPVLGISLKAGRLPRPDDAGSHRVVVNEALVRRLFPARNPVGDTLFIQGEHARGAVPHEIVGVVGTADNGEGAEPAAYEALGSRSEWLWTAGNDRQKPPHILYRLAGVASAKAIAEAAARLEPQVHVSYTALSAAVRERFSEERFSVLLAAGVGGLALVLASVGVFGMFAYAVRQQTREIGVRLAMGASAAQIVVSVLRTGTRPLLLGLGTGLIGSAIVGQLMRGNLYGLSPYDPVSHLAVTAIVLAAAVVALVRPAFRATRVDPATVLRTD
jgi:predicted permease